jgi:hypothetical protein
MEGCRNASAVRKKICRLSRLGQLLAFACSQSCLCALFASTSASIEATACNRLSSTADMPIKHQHSTERC